MIYSSQKTIQMTKNKTAVTHAPHQLLPGDVIRKGSKQVLHEGSEALKALYEQHSECSGVSFSLFHDEKDRNILLSSEQSGVFYPIYQEGGKKTEERTLAIQLADLIKITTLPVIVKLLHGWVPMIQCDFTGTLYLFDMDLEDTVVASTFVREIVVSLEIPLESDIKFQVANTNVQLKSSPEWTSALRHCKANAPNFTKAMKVIRPQGSVDIDESSLGDRESPYNNLSEVKTDNSQQPSSITMVKEAWKNDLEHLRMLQSSLGGGDSSYNNLSEVKTDNSHQPSSITMVKEAWRNDPVQLRKPQSDLLSRSFRLPSVNSLSRRVGVYASDQSFNMDIMLRRKQRKNAIRIGKSGQLRPNTTPQTLPRTAGHTRNPLPCRISSPEEGDSSYEDNTNCDTVYNTIHVISKDDYSLDLSAIQISAKGGRPVDTQPDSYINLPIKESRVPPGLPSISTRGNYDGTNHEVARSPSRLRSSVFHLVQGSEGIITISPRTFREETQDEGYGESDTEDGNTPLFLFHGSIENQDHEYVTPSELASESDVDENTDYKFPFHPQESYRPPLPPRPKQLLTNAEYGCYNREMLIDELKKAIPISTTEELALKSLNMAEFTSLLWHPKEEIENLLVSLVPNIGALNLKNIAMYFLSKRSRVRILTEI
ncbi:uncharacterized protein LOC106050637 isoform X2 [Biomphalaria glabrata]|uniref:Uncharacterized protein LOC106050637 isoform X2 n=1 Tax=Biomphalaria glabrata TaxID=6526 RepID=A0A9W3A4Z8_BIOGL|nr:uncharacterized protein LOC106050637 isoform X2 [Biomphalaria glabrata]